MLAEADNKGRISSESKDQFNFNIDYFRELTRDLGCESKPYPFPSDHSRFLYFQSGGTRQPDYKAHDDTKCEVVVMAGFPGAGKDTWIKKNLPKWPMVSLDDIRKELELPHGSHPGPVIFKAKEMFREHLRKGQSFVFNAKNLNPDIRLPWLTLAAKYNARIRIVYLEVPLSELIQRNKTREEDARIPEAALYGMLEKWDIPHPSEAHTIEYHFGGV
jgi:predicted kinase